MAADYVNNNVKSFWRKIKAKRGQWTVVVEQIDSARDHNTIAEVFTSKFSSVNGIPPNAVPMVNYASVTDSEVKISTDEMKAAIK